MHRLLLALTVLALVAPQGAATHDDDMPTGPGDAVFYAQVYDDSGTWFLSAQKEHPQQFVGGYGTGTGCYVQNPICEPSTAEITFSIPITLEDELELTAGAEVTMNAWLGSTSRSGRVEVTAQLTLDGSVIANGAAQEITYQAQYEHVSWTIEPTVSVLPAGGKLSWEIQINGVHQGIFLRMADSPGWSHIVLPIAGIGAAPEVMDTFEDVASASLSRNFAFQTPQDGSHTMNWTAPANVTYSYRIETIEGAVDLQVTEVDGTVLLSASEGQENGTLAAVAGHWQIQLSYAAFVGNVTLSFSPTPQESGPEGEPVGSSTSTSTGPGSTSESSTSGSDTSTATGNGTKGSGNNDAPGPAIVLVLAGFVAAALVARRRT